ncbi:MAG: GNAT family N-acetyltransferase [Variovorax sp.]|nr:GNAT family N-acetyltransferase [Variovorax sp.]
MAISAFVVKVPAAELLVGPLRERFDATSKLGVPAHITVLVPFMDPGDITTDVLEKAQRALEQTAAFSFELGSVGRFPETAYLVPEPPAPFVAMTRAIAEAFPGFPPYAGEHHGVVPHLTVAHGNAAEADEAAETLRLRLDQGAAVKANCSSVTLIENSTGRWKDLHEFHLPQEIRVRPATEDDAAAACEVIRNSILECCGEDHRFDATVVERWLRNKTPEFVRKIIVAPTAFSYVAVVSGATVGFASAVETGEVTLCYVAPSVRFTGVGKALLAAIEEHAAGAGVEALRLESTRTARPFYTRNGFIPDGPPVSAFGIEGLPMRKQLSPAAKRIPLEGITS